MQRVAAFIISIVFMILAALLILGIIIGNVLGLPGFDKLATSLVMLILSALLGLGGWLLRLAFRKPKSETSIVIPKGASQAVVQAIQALDRNDPSEWKNAIDNMGQMKDPAAKEALVNATTHPIRDVRFKAAFKLAEFGDDRSVPGINEALYAPNDPEFQMAHQASNALDRLGTQAVPSFIEALDHQDSEIRFQTARTLGQIGFRSNESVEPLLKSLERDQEWQVRQAAAISLGEMGDKSVLPRLLKVLRKEQEINVIEGIITALGKLGDESIVQTLINVSYG